MGVYVCTYFTGPVRRINGGTYRQLQMQSLSETIDTSYATILTAITKTKHPAKWIERNSPAVSCTKTPGQETE